MDPVQKAVINHTFGVPLIKTKRPVISCNVCQIRFNSEVRNHKKTKKKQNNTYRALCSLHLSHLPRGVTHAVYTQTPFTSCTNFFRNVLDVGRLSFPVFSPESGYWHRGCGAFVWALFWQLWTPLEFNLFRLQCGVRRNNNHCSTRAAAETG